MTRDEIKNIVGLLMAAYPSRKIEDLKALVDAYIMGLEDYAYADVEKAVKAIIKVKKYFPTVAEIIDQIKADERDKPHKLGIMYLRQEELRQYDQPNWHRLASEMRANGYECAAAAMERKASGLHDTTGLLLLADVLKPEMAMVEG